jgi:hypothetical protein
MGDPIVPPEPQFQIAKHLNLVGLFQRTKFFRGCFEFEVLKVDLDPQCMGDLIIPPGLQFQITKYLNLAILAKAAKFFVGVLNSRF